MKTKAAVLWGLNQKWDVDEVDLDGPKYGEVMVRLAASGLCHSDHHLVTGDIPRPLPVVGGHEGAGTVVEIGPGVTGLAEGDSVVFSFLPACGRCRPCARGMSNLCELGAYLMLGPQIDGTYRFHARGHDIGQNCVLGSFSEYTTVPEASVIKLDDGTPLDKAALVGCGVTTGYGSAVRTGETRDGDTVVVMGVGGVGINAVQGARIAGARNIVALDPVEYKRNRAREFGATHVAASVGEAVPLVTDLTLGRMAEVCVVTVDVAESAHVGQALSLVGKRGKVVMTAVPHPTDATVDLSLMDMTFYEKQVRGSLFGSSNPRDDIFRLLGLYESGQLKLDELITREYALEDINEAYQDTLSGLNLRGLIRF
ncbi:NDMA-dependent alcohol dehydrogenase [Mycobacterium sp.]|uniref:NDMA-dependent alcohol dehydrogenase n=1 Tax=Mycobacterium sp. TaxID=1785 RepID=UPI000CBA4668|nr:NDMA-dependent alcohol dehydrogenase [Mycobacterium sp.]PJE06011.1 MAG: alcohol dehydrogenase [Mycobacterium sp.]